MESTSNSSGQYNTSAKSNANSSSNTGAPGSVGSETNESSPANSLNMGNITDMLGNLNIQETFKKYSGTATKAISSLSTTQKVIGGALLVLGAAYLTKGSRGGWMKKASALAGMGKMVNGKNKNKSGR